MAEQFKSTVVQKRLDILLVPREKIVDTDYAVPLVQKTFAEMGAEKSSPSCHQNIFARHCNTLFLFP